AKAQYREALIEYANVLQIDGTNTRAIRQLALSHYQLGELGQAYPYLLKSKELDRDNLDVRLKLGIIYLLGQRPERAWTEAISALDQDPKNLEVLALLAEAARAQREVETAIRRLEGVRAEFSNSAKLYLALGTLYLRNQDPSGAARALKE